MLIFRISCIFINKVNSRFGLFIVSFIIYLFLKPTVFAQSPSIGLENGLNRCIDSQITIINSDRAKAKSRIEQTVNELKNSSDLDSRLLTEFYFGKYDIPTKSEITKTLEHSLSVVDSLNFKCPPQNILSVLDEMGNTIYLSDTSHTVAFVLPVGSSDIYFMPAYFKKLDFNKRVRDFTHELMHLSLPYQSFLSEAYGRSCARNLAIQNTKHAKLNADSHALFVEDVYFILNPGFEIESPDMGDC